MTTTTELDVLSCPLQGATLIEASAGTGKTYNICGLYLRMLLERNWSVQQILVVTFTNAATAELRDRIRTRIAETLRFLMEDTGQPGDPFVSALIRTVETHHGLSRAQMVKILDLALQTFDEAAIFTIHGFCQRALADTPFAAGMPFAQELVQDDRTHLLEAVHDFWRRHIGCDNLPEDLAAYLLEMKDCPDSLASLLKRHLAKPKATYRWPEPVAVSGALKRIEELFSAAKSTWLAESESIVDILKNAANNDALKSTYTLGAIEEAASWTGDFFRSDTARAIPASLREVKMKLFRASSLAGAVKKNKTTPTHPFFAQVDVLLAELPALQERAASELTYARMSLFRDFLEKASAELRQKKRDKRVTAFDDMLYNVFDALHCGEYPWLADTIRRRYPAALIDEFQDTDPLQFAIFNSIYSSGDTSLFLVGDPKQAIYSFRNADLHTYLQAKEKTNATYTLSANQRSSKALIEGLNALFGSNPQAFMLAGLDYQTVRFGDKPRKQLVDRSAPRADLQIWTLPSDDNSAIDRTAAKHAAVNATAAEIARLLNEAHDGKILLGDRPLQPGDIAVLVRSHAQGSDIRAALAALNIASVELSQASVFHSPDAADIESLLCAIMEPSRTGLLLAALATPLVGMNAMDIAAVTADEKKLMAYLEKFMAYREMWFTRGIGYMYRQFLANESVSTRMLCRADGERRLTNLLHIGEHLHQAELDYSSPDAMLRWFQSRRRDETADEAAQVRLESDQNLVQIITIHKSKGLEYPVVFCPFLWDAHQMPPRGIEGYEYHSQDGVNVIDMRTDGEAVSAAKEIIKFEQAAESLRLIYVALTRAANRCYLVAGSYAKSVFGKPSVKEGTHNLLNWLVAGAGMSPQAWFATALTPGQISRQWEELANRAGPAISLAALPMDPGLPVQFGRPDVHKLAYRLPPSSIRAAWRIGSFSHLRHGTPAERTASDHDMRIVAPARQPVPEALDANDILSFPRGPSAGVCLHAVFEGIDFRDSAGWDAAIDDALLRHPQPARGGDGQEKQADQKAMVRTMLHDVLQTPLPDGFTLGKVPANRRLNELEFHLPANCLSANSLNTFLKARGYDVAPLAFRDLEGYLKGFIDLVFEHGGRYYVLDWKSNHLGFAKEDYGQDGMAIAMASHGYHLQSLLYCVALQRFLAHRLPDYDYATHFGGVLYLFVRGVRPAWTLADGSQAGVYYHRPALDTLDALEQLIAPTAAREAA